ncbi:DUF4446 family protein [Candidatus Microgenomates bacterium]|nr:DUF4446 family protein [Candidatus Microgenomates bacterium]
MIESNAPFIVLTLWLFAVTAWTVYRELQLRRFLGKAKSGDVRKLIENLLEQTSATNDTIKNAGQVLAQIQKKDLKHIQKIGLVRFNPFRDVGGNQSFTLALLNDEDTGIVLTGLHARESTRLYVKDVIRGTSRSELSREEKQALEVAKK